MKRGEGAEECQYLEAGLAMAGHNNACSINFFRFLID